MRGRAMREDATWEHASWEDARLGAATCVDARREAARSDVEAATPVDAIPEGAAWEDAHGESLTPSTRMRRRRTAPSCATPRQERRRNAQATRSSGRRPADQRWDRRALVGPPRSGFHREISGFQREVSGSQRGTTQTDLQANLWSRGERRCPEVTTYAAKRGRSHKLRLRACSTRLEEIVPSQPRSIWKGGLIQPEPCNVTPDAWQKAAPSRPAA
jgi:hypothetical protein